MEQETILKIKGDTQQAVTSIKDIRNALKETKDAMAGLEEGSDTWLLLAKQAGEYKHQLDAINQSVRGASSDFGDMLGNVSSVGAGIAGAFQTASAAISMFGAESEDIAKAIKSMQNMMAITQGLGQIDTAIKSFDKLKATIMANTTAMKALKAVMTPKVFLGISAAVTVLSVAVKSIVKQFEKANKVVEQNLRISKSQINVEKDAVKTYEHEALKLKTLVAIAKDETTSISTRKKAVEVLNRDYSELNAKIDEQTGQLNINSEAWDKLTSSMLSNAMAKGALDLIEQNSKEIAKLTIQINEAEKEIESLEKKAQDLYDSADYGWGEEYVSGIQSQAKAYEEKAEKQKEVVDKLKEEYNEINRINQLLLENNKDAIVDFFKENNKTGVKGTGSYSYQIDYDIKRLELQKQLNAGTLKEVEIQKKLTEAYRDKLNIINGNVEAQKKLTDAQIKNNEKLIKEAQTQLDIEKSKSETANLYLQLINSANSKETISNIYKDALESLGKMNDETRRFEETYISLNSYIQILIAGIEKENQLLKYANYIEDTMNGKKEDSLKILNDEIDGIVKEIAALDKLKESAENKEFIENAINKLLVKEADLVNRRVEQEDELTVLLAKNEKHGATELKILETQLSVEKKKLNATKEGSIERERQLVVIAELESRIYDIEYQKRLLEIENQQYQYDSGTEHMNEHMYQLQGEIQYLQMKIELQNEIVENAKEIYGVESVEYLSALSSLRSMKTSLESVKYSAVNVATQGIGYIGDMLSSLADMQDEQTKDGFEKQKKLQVGATIMNGLAGAISAVSSWMNPANAWMTAPVQAIMGAAQAAAIGIATAAQVKQILNTKFDGGQVSSGAVNSLTLVPPVDYSSAVQGSNIEENTSDTKSYVSVTEIENVGNRVGVAENESRY